MFLPLGIKLIKYQNKYTYLMRKNAIYAQLTGHIDFSIKGILGLAAF